MAGWRNIGFWRNARASVWVLLLILTASESGANWMDGSSSGRKRVFTPGFFVLCAFVAVIELVALSHYYYTYR
jgi:hypothetical protein